MSASTSRLAERYRKFLILLVIGVFFTNWATYATIFVTPSFPTLYWAIILGLLAIPLIFMDTKSVAFLNLPLVIWAFVFITITVLWFLIIPGGDFQILKNRTLSVILIVLFCIVFGRARDTLNFTRSLILLAMLLAAVCYLIDFLRPFTFVPQGSPLSNPGRAAGFYINANEAGCALLLGMLLTIGAVRVRWRQIFAIGVFCAVVLTFSRAAVLGWFVAVFILWMQGYIRAGKIARISIPLAFILIMAWPTIHAYVSSGTMGRFGNVLARINWFLDPALHSQNLSEQQRLLVLRKGWQLFLQQPVFGNGIGSTTLWNLPVSTHNMYLLFMDDYGILGLLMYVLLPASLVLGSRGEGRRIAISIAVLLLYWGVFSHNELDNYYSLVALSLTAAMGAYLKDSRPSAETNVLYTAA